MIHDADGFEMWAAVQRYGGAVNLASSPGTPAGLVRSRGMSSYGPFQLHHTPAPPPKSVTNVRHLPDPERRHRVSELRARPRHRLRDRRAKLLRRVRPPDGLAPIQHIHFRQAKRRNRTEQHHRHAMAHQVQNHKPMASTPNIPDHLDKVL